MLCYNSYSSPNLDGFNPYELTIGHKMTINPDLEVQPDIVVSGTFRIYYEKLKKNVQYLCSILQRFRSQRTDLLNKSKKYHAYQAGQIVYMYQVKGTIVQTTSRKIAWYDVWLAVCRLYMLWQPGILPTYFLMFLSTIPVAPMMTGMT